MDRFYGLSAKLNEAFTNNGKDLVLQLSVKNEQKLDCGGAYIKLTGDVDQDSFGGDTPYQVRQYIRSRSSISGRGGGLLYVAHMVVVDHWLPRRSCVENISREGWGVTLYIVFKVVMDRLSDPSVIVVVTYLGRGWIYPYISSAVMDH